MCISLVEALGNPVVNSVCPEHSRAQGQNLYCVPRTRSEKTTAVPRPREGHSHSPVVTPHLSQSEVGLADYGQDTSSQQGVAEGNGRTLLFRDPGARQETQIPVP